MCDPSLYKCLPLLVNCLSKAKEKSLILEILNSKNFPLLMVGIMFVFYLIFLLIWKHYNGISFESNQAIVLHKEKNDRTKNINHL